jgi:hypothetical protein
VELATSGGGGMTAPYAKTIYATDPHLAQDIEDGAALRRLREALPEGWDLIVRNFGSRWGVELWDPRYPVSHDEPPQPRFLEIEPTLAVAADKAREAIEADR